jgi:hypothetical protein
MTVKAVGQSLNARLASSIEIKRVCVFSFKVFKFFCSCNNSNQINLFWMKRGLWSYQVEKLDIHIGEGGT